MQFATNNMLLVVAALLVAAAPAAVRSLSDGAPVGACKDMVPQHHTAAQTSAAPYTVTATKRGAVYDVKIAGQSAANTIKGFMVQAKHNGKLVGEFVVAAGDKHTQYVNCGGNGKVGVHMVGEGYEVVGSSGQGV